MSDEGAATSAVGEASAAQLIPAVERALQHHPTVWNLKRELKDEIIKQRYSPENLQGSLKQIMETLGIAAQLQNLAMRECAIASRARAQKHPRSMPPLPEPLESNDVVSQAAKEWRNSLLQRLRRLSRDLGVPFARLRTPTTEAQRRNREMLAERRFDQQFREQPEESDEFQGFTFAHTGTGGTEATNDIIFSADDFLNHIAAIVNHNHSQSLTHVKGWGLLRIELPTPGFPQLRETFKELHPQHRQFGVDDQLVGEKFSAERLRIALTALGRGATTELRFLCRNGLPVSSRAAIWKAVLNVQVTPRDRQWYEQLGADVQKVELLTDDAARWEVRLASNDHRYFPFDEMLESTVLTFNRDVTIPQRKGTAIQLLPRLAMTHRDGTTGGFFPPSGVVPFEGMAFLVGPLCFLYTDPVELYLVWRELFVRYWCQLQALSTGAGCVLRLCRLFESLLQYSNPALVYHCVHALGIHPLRIAFRWMLQGFSGVLEVDQVLLLWDRVLGFDSIELLAVAAAALFLWRAGAVLACESEAEVHVIFSDNSKIQIIPFLQHLLFNS